jgi:molybdenum cofactor sulfurtransferase
MSTPSDYATSSVATSGAVSASASSEQAADEQQAWRAFLQQNPRYEATSALDAYRERELGRLDRTREIYLDHTGGGLYADAQLREHLALLSSAVFGNPHSINETSRRSTKLVEQAREYVLRHFGADPALYEVVFTANASGALKLVGESFPFEKNSRFLLSFDNHNSVNGIREFATARGARVDYVPVVAPDLRLDHERLEAQLSDVGQGPSLFAYPAQSNFSGVQHDLEWVARAQEKGFRVLLDAAAFAPTNQLDLSRVRPDFVTLSFYKILGYPTGIGALIVKRDAAATLVRPWYAGGTSAFSSVRAFDGAGTAYFPTPGPARFEDGTLDYLGIPAVEIGLRMLDAIGFDVIHDRVTMLTGWLLAELAALTHSNGRPIVRVYGPAGTEGRGGTVLFNVFDAHGRMWDCHEIVREAAAGSISIRGGCHCNPGAREVALELDEQTLRACFRDKNRLSFEEFIHVIDGHTTGAARASFGFSSNFADAYRFASFLRTFRDRNEPNDPAALRGPCVTLG